MRRYADSSFLVSCYVTDSNTVRAKAVLSTMQMPLVFTDLHALEIENAFQLGIFRGQGRNQSLDGLARAAQGLRSRTAFERPCSIWA